MIRFRCAGRVLAAIAVSMLSLAGAWPASAATARLVPPPSGQDTPSPVTVIRTVTVGGTPGWQIVLIAVVAALLTAAAAVMLDRARAARRA